MNATAASNSWAFASRSANDFTSDARIGPSPVSNHVGFTPCDLHNPITKSTLHFAVFVSAGDGEGLAELRRLIAAAIEADALNAAAASPSAGLGEPGTPLTDNVPAAVHHTHA